MNLNGRHVVVTGGGSGLGKAMATRYLELGAEIYICGRRKSVLEETAKEMMNSHGGSVKAMACDIKVPEAIEEMIENIWAEGPLSGLVNNAASIRLDDNPVIGANNSNTFSPQRSVDSGYTASTKIVVDNNSPSIFEYSLTTDGTREIQIIGAAKKGINAEATETSCLGETSMRLISFGLAKPISPAFLTGSSSSVKLSELSNSALA